MMMFDWQIRIRVRGSDSESEGTKLFPSSPAHWTLFPLELGVWRQPPNIWLSQLAEIKGSCKCPYALQ